MDISLHDIVASYNDRSPLELAYTIPALWYVDARVAELERQNVFGRTWQVVARADQLQSPGRYVTTDLAGEPLVIVRGNDQQLRAFYNVCRAPRRCGRDGGARHGEHPSLSLSRLELRSRWLTEGRAGV
jgi:choline monooxygenase